MAKKVVECVPNFSEGRRQDVVQALADAVRATPGVSLLDIDPGASTNRTVLTFVGPPEAVIEAALNAAKVAYKMIDMSKHKGEHPRMGAMDVCPLVPVANVSMEECVALSLELARRLAAELEVPVFLYEAAQKRGYRRSLAQIRSGEYEGLEDKLKLSDWAPDFGPTQFIPRWGATVVGARQFLIAYNVNILGTKQQAHRIAVTIRESGKGPHKLKAVKALGWFLEENQLAQVSMNLTDYHTTGLLTAYQHCSTHAKELGVAVVGSEVVGLLPLGALLAVGEELASAEGLMILSTQHKLRLAVERLGLNSLAEFNPQEKIIEYRTGILDDGPLLKASVRSFVEQLAARSSTPGGGSAAALTASMGAALGTMVGLLTYGYRKFESEDPAMRAALPPLYSAMQTLLGLVDADTSAFAGYSAALKLPQATDEEKARRREALDAGLKRAIDVPLQTMQAVNTCWPHISSVATHGNSSALSDVQVGAHSLLSGAYGAHCNVLINVRELVDTALAATLRGEADQLLREAKEGCGRVEEIASGRLEQTQT